VVDTWWTRGGHVVDTWWTLALESGETEIM